MLQIPRLKPSPRAWEETVVTPEIKPATPQG